MPEAEWNRLGGVDEQDVAYGVLPTDCGIFGCYDTEVFEVGRVDLYGEVYNSTSNEDYYAAVQNITQYPGVDYSDRKVGINNSTRMVHDWLGSDDIINIREWGPTEPKTGSLDWSLGVSAGGGVGGSVSASYDVPYIDRDTVVDIDDHMRGNRYEYPGSLAPFDEEGRKNIVGLENICTAVREPEPCSSPYCNFQDIVRFDTEASFYLQRAFYNASASVTEDFMINVGF